MNAQLSHQLVYWRCAFHQNPELTNRTARISDRLQQEAQLQGRQPEEKTFNGAKQLIDAVVNHGVQTILGMHNAPVFPLNTFKHYRAFYANVDCLVIRICGKVAHTARPDEGIDAIFIASPNGTSLHPLPVRTFCMLAPLVANVLCFSAGNTWNVLPETIALKGRHKAEIPAQIPERLTTLEGRFCSLFASSPRDLCQHWQ